jgi:hypothetical protein
MNQRTLMLSLLLAVAPMSVQAADVAVDLTAEYGGEWSTAGSGSYVLDNWGRRYRVSVRLYAGSEAVAQWWDDPTDREQDFTATFDDTSPRVRRFVAKAWYYNGGPWEASRTYAIGENVAVGSPVLEGMLLTARKTGALATADVMTCLAPGTAVEDNEDGTVAILVTGEHPFVAGDVITLWGAGPYDGPHTLPVQVSQETLTLTASYTAHSITEQGNPHARLAAGAAGSAEPTWPVAKTITDGGSVVDNSDGTVSIPCPAHGFVAGDEVLIAANSVYDGPHTLPAQADPDLLTITAPYTAFTVDGSARAMRRYTVDNGVTWEVLPSRLVLPSISSLTSNRVLIRGTGGESGSMGTTGMKFHLRGQ